MKNNFVYIACFFSFFLFGYYSATSQSSTGGIDYDTVKNYTDIQGNKQGTWIKHHPNGQLRYKGFFIDDVPVGEFKRFHLNGNKQSHKTFNEDGSCSIKYWWENGRKAAEGQFDADRQRTGLWKIYYKEGSLLSKINYKNGLAHGNVILYYPGTNIMLLDCYYEEGALNGKYTKYFNNGAVMQKGTYKDGLRHGYYQFFTPEGFVDEEGEYLHGSKHGEWTFYDEHGELDEVLTYDRGIPDNFDEIMQEWDERREWAKDNQHKFADPHEFFDNPYEFFRDRPDPFEKYRQQKH